MQVRPIATTVGMLRSIASCILAKEYEVIGMRQDARGFTLVELMTVIVIIGVLSAIGIPSYKGTVDKAKTEACKANRRILSTAVATYYLEHSTYYKLDSVGNPRDEVIEVADLTDYVENAEELKCPAGGNYTIIPGNDGKASSVVICCDHEGHGDFVVFGTSD